MKKSYLFVYPIFLVMIVLTSCKSKPVRLITGSYTEETSNGFNIFDLNPEKGTFNLLSSSEAGPNPSYFCVSGTHGLIYAANEVMEFKGEAGGGVTVLKYDAIKGTVEKINDLLVPFGGPCYISLSPSEDFLFLANYSSSSVAVVKLDVNGIPMSVTDSILFDNQEDKVSHPHMISFDPAGKRVYLSDLGLDRIVIYNFNKITGRLEQVPNGIVTLPEGAGPRHFVFSADGTKMYVICELNSTISVFSVNVNGEIDHLQTLTTLSDDFTGESYCADIHIGLNGIYLYGSNRGENTIVTYRVETDGRLTLAGRTNCGGNWPRNFVIDPTGKFLLVGNQRSGNISLFRIDEESGIPFETGKSYNISAPVCLKFYLDEEI